MLRDGSLDISVTLAFLPASTENLAACFRSISVRSGWESVSDLQHFAPLLGIVNVSAGTGVQHLRCTEADLGHCDERLAPSQQWGSQSIRALQSQPVEMAAAAATDKQDNALRAAPAALVHRLQQSLQYGSRALQPTWRLGLEAAAALQVPNCHSQVRMSAFQVQEGPVLWAGPEVMLAGSNRCCGPSVPEWARGPVRISVGFQVTLFTAAP